MSGGLAFEVAGLRELTADLHAAPARVAVGVRKVTSKGALNIKGQLRTEMGSSRSFKGITSTIAYDLIDDNDGITAEIGPSAEPGSPGNLANIAYFGGSRGGGTVPDPQLALDAEEPNFLAALEALTEEVI
jgi:hypothetical protein